ncbi:MAG: NFACT family protein, partial [Bacteroidota bacterium]
MFTSWLTYCRVAEELDTRLRGARIAAVYTQQKNEIVIEVDGGEGPRYLVFSTLPRLASLQLKDEFARARKNSLDLLPDLAGDTITGAAIAGDDRIIRLALASGRAVYALLFPVRANILLFDGSELVDSYKQYEFSVDAIGRDYDAATAPPDESTLSTSLSIPDTTLAAALRKLHPWLSGRFAQELFHRASLDGEHPAASCKSSDIARLHLSLRDMLEEADAGSSRVYLDEKRPVCFSLIRMTHLEEMTEEMFYSALDGISFFLRRHY